MKSLITKGAIAAVLAAMAIAGPAASGPFDQEILVMYYANEAKTIQVGESYRGCDGNSYVWGSRTTIMDRYVTPCP
jgi:hypothetical protein